MNIINSLLIVGLFIAMPALVHAKTALQRLYQMPRASLYVEGDSHYRLRENTARVPASTLKVLTGLLALKTWKPEHRFATDFYVTGNQLTIKGYGDPYLTSEELDWMIDGLIQKGLTSVKVLNIDHSYFADHINIDGRSQTNNPYDAPLSALAVNFNTLSIRRNKQGIYSGESQTPLTPLMRTFAKALPRGRHRVNLKKQRYAPRYFAEVLRAKLRQRGFSVSNKIIETTVSPDQPVFYRHYNSKTLSEIIAAMLKYSNNFIANQLFLMLGAEQAGAPATISKSQQVYSAKVKAMFGWTKTFYEGAGLSRRNFLTAKELVEVLKQFAPYKQLLKAQNKAILAKTGTLTGVSTYAGYLYKNQQWKAFALLINHSVHGNFRKKVAAELLR